MSKSPPAKKKATKEKALIEAKSLHFRDTNVGQSNVEKLRMLNHQQKEVKVSCLRTHKKLND